MESKNLNILIIGAKKFYNAEFFFYKAFRKLGHDVHFLDQYMGIRRKDFIRIIVSHLKVAKSILKYLPINNYILNEIKINNYDLILVFKGELLTEESLLKLSKYNTWLFYPDTYRYKALLEDRLSLFEGVFVTTDRHSYYYSLGARRIHTIWWACDPEIHKPYAEQKIYDVSFVGTFYPNRYVILRRLRVKPHIFGKYWILKAGIHHPPVYGEEYAKVVGRTKINLNIHHPVDVVANAPNMRTFEIACMRGFLLTEEMDSLKHLFSKVAMYRDIGDLNEKIEYYLEDENGREEISRIMYEEAVKKHTYLERAREILEVAL